MARLGRIVREILLLTAERCLLDEIRFGEDLFSKMSIFILITCDTLGYSPNGF
jgi:hypothetical protein